MIRAFGLAMALALTACGTGIGDPCHQDEDCGDVGYCANAGICTKKCSTSDPASCPQGSACTAFGERQICLLRCESNDGCGDNEGCVSGTCQIAEPLAPPNR